MRSFITRAGAWHSFRDGRTGAIVSALEGAEAPGCGYFDWALGEAIAPSGRQITGVELESGQTMDADLVVFNGDQCLYRHMLPEQSAAVA